MTKKVTAKELRAEAQAIRSAADSQKDDIQSGNFPKKLGQSYFDDRIAHLERKAVDLEAQADRLERGD